MKILLGLFLLIIRIFVAFKIILWLFLKGQNPQLHSMSEIEFYVVFLIMDIWILTSSSNFEFPDKE